MMLCSTPLMGSTHGSTGSRTRSYRLSNVPGQSVPSQLELQPSPPSSRPFTPLPCVVTLAIPENLGNLGSSSIQNLVAFHKHHSFPPTNRPAYSPRQDHWTILMPGPSASSASQSPSAKFLSGVSALVLLQAASRVLTFVLNQALVRLASPAIFGTAAIN